MNSSLHGLRCACAPMPRRAIPEPRKYGRGLAFAGFAALLMCGAVAADARASATGTQPLSQIAQATPPQAPNGEPQAPYPAPAQDTPAPTTGGEPPSAASPVEPVQGAGEAGSGAPAQAPAEPGSAEPATEAGGPDAADPLTEPFEAQAPSQEAFGAEDDLLPRDLSPMGMFMNADIVVKAVMVGLALASFLTWVIWLAKSLELFGARGRARKVLTILNGARTLDDAVRQIGANGRGPAALMVSAAREETTISDVAIAHAGGAGLKDRVASALERIEIAAGRGMARGTGVLATIGSTAPFVGLFGTVWGIMNSFIGISEAQTTNLAVVAPGIAEALLATALGLVAAIPAVIIYNAFARSIVSYRQLLADAASAVQRLVSRDLDFRGLPASRPAGASVPEGGKPSRRVLEGQEAK